ncbi:MAG: DMT family transporter [Rhizobacter sp.]|nr:DMT family transporter [Rhizobacter sp.]
MPHGSPHALARLLPMMPWVFVLIWSTGFIVARYGMPHAPPLSFLSLRYALSVLCLVAWSVLAGASWPRERKAWLHLAVTGTLLHAGYLGGVWAAVKSGMGAATAALLVGMQPVLTAVWLSTHAGGQGAARPARREWFGLLLGLAGLTLVVQGKVGFGEVTPWNLALALLALLSITAGTLYQKRFVAPCDVRTANTIQLLAALAVSLPFALLEQEAMRWHPHLIGAMAWSVLVLTIGGSSLLYLLIQRGAATRVASLLYLVPPCTAVLAWLLFGETFTAVMLLGIVLAVAGVSMVVRAPAAASK